MNIGNRNRNLAIPHIGPPKRAISQIAFCVLGGLLLTPFLAQAASVTVNLGPSAQNITLVGLGPNSSGLGQYSITLGACTPAGGNTTCILSGTFTGTTPGLTSGTYSLATNYVGTGPTPMQGVQQSAGSNFWLFSSVPATLTVTLTLVSSSGTVVAPIISGGQFAAGAAINFLYDPQPGVCSGTPVSQCSVSQVGQAAGAVEAGPSSGGATFNQGNNYYISQLAFAGGWQMTLTYVNYSPQTITCVTNFYSDTGGALSVPFSGGTVSSRTDILQPGQSIHDQSVADLNAMVSQGWAQATCDGPIQASLLYRLYASGVPVGEASVNAETAPTTEFVTFAQTATGVAYGNPSTTQSATITITVINAAGALLGNKIIVLGPLAHGAANLGPLLGLQSFTGSVHITSTIPIISLSLNFEAFPVFSSLPPGDLPGSTTLVN
jgi:hypothetical protein